LFSFHCRGICLPFIPSKGDKPPRCAKTAAHGRTRITALCARGVGTVHRRPNAGHGRHRGRPHMRQPPSNDQISYAASSAQTSVIVPTISNDLLPFASKLMTNRPVA
jgi:hypothetical protein